MSSTSRRRRSCSIPRSRAPTSGCARSRRSDSRSTGAGHNALGAWLWLASSGRLSAVPAQHLEQEIAGQLLGVEVRTAPNGLITVAMDQSAPVFGSQVGESGRLAEALGIDPGDLAAEAAQVVSTGAGHLLVPVRDRSVVDAVRPDPRRLAGVLDAVGGEGCYVYCTTAHEPGEGVAYTRFFNPTMGIAEDPATGTAAGPLIAKLAQSGLIEPVGSFIVEQGHALGRPSRLRVDLDGDQVKLSGSGVVVMSGNLHL